MSSRHGALPPPGMRWQTGKTAASIRFVNEATTYIADCDDETAVAALQSAIDRIKKGEWVLTEFLDPEKYLEMLDDF